MVHNAGKGRHESLFEAAFGPDDVGCQTYKATAQVDGAQAELRQALALGEAAPAGYAHGQGRSVLSLQKICSTLLRKIGPATNPARAELLTQATARAEDADAKTLRKLALRLMNMRVHRLGLPDHARAQITSYANLAPQWQGHFRFFYSQRSSVQRLRFLSVEQPIFAGERSDGQSFHFLLGQAIHTRSSGSSHSAAIDATTLVCPSSIHADPHPTVAPSPARIFSWWVHHGWMSESEGAGLISSSYSHHGQAAVALIGQAPI